MIGGKKSILGVTRPVAVAATLFFGLGVLFWVTLEVSMDASNTETFCISCHEMSHNVYPEYRRSAHYINRTGVRATCPDCHVPRDWIHKVIRKVHATNELYHWLIGSIDTRQKFVAKRSQLAQQVWQSMRATDSRECRNCHDEAFMALADQGSMAGKMHVLSDELELTCIDCHQGIAHQLPAEFDQQLVLDELHVKIEQKGFACHQCHDDVLPVDDEQW